MDPPGCGGEHPLTGVQTQIGGAGGWKFLQKCVKKQKFCLKMRGNRDSRKIFRLRQATFVEQYDIWCIKQIQ